MLLTPYTGIVAVPLDDNCNSANDSAGEQTNDAYEQIATCPTVTGAPPDVTVTVKVALAPWATVLAEAVIVVTVAAGGVAQAIGTASPIIASKILRRKHEDTVEQREARSAALSRRSSAASVDPFWFIELNDLAREIFRRFIGPFQSKELGEA